MAGELIKKNDPPQVVGPHGLGPLIKPLSKEIFLLQTKIAGTSHIKDQSVFEELKEADPIFLQREENTYDQQAILVLDSKKRKLGYIPQNDNLILSRLMDGGKLLSGKVREIDQKGKYWRIGIDISMIDF